MTVAHDYDDAYDDLHHLIDGLQPDQARRLLRLVKSDPEFVAAAGEGSAADADEQDDEADQRLAVVGCLEGGPADLAERSQEYVREYFNNSL
jgi:hypothetical protein